MSRSDASNWLRREQRRCHATFQKAATDMNDEQTPQYPAGQYPAGQSSEPEQTPGSGGAEPPVDDRAAQRPVAPGANWYPEPWVESDPARHWAQGSGLTPAG